MGEQLYPVAAKAVLRKPAAELLTEVQEELGDQGLGTKVFDGYRPYEVTERMWDPARTPTTSPTPVKDPVTIEAAWWTLRSLTATVKSCSCPQTSRTPARGPDTTTKDLSEGATRNRDLLREVIKSHGFVGLET